jgi:hypothetical protein
MSIDNDKPYVLRVAELIYSQVVKIKNENSEITNIQAFEVFMTTKDYDLISSGEFHDKWFLELKNNDFVDKITGKKVNDETMRLLEIQKDSMVKFLMKIPKLYYTKSHFPLKYLKEHLITCGEFVKVMKCGAKKLSKKNLFF